VYTVTYGEGKREREKRNTAGAGCEENGSTVYTWYNNIASLATLAEAASPPPLPSSPWWVPKNPADRNSKGEAMRNEPSEPVRVVTRCALLCLGSRAGPSHSLRLLVALRLSFPSDLFLSRERRERGWRNKRVREHLENDQPSGQRALGTASRYYLKEVLCIYRYIQQHDRACISQTHWQG